MCLCVSSYVYIIYRKVNPSACVDMDCDGLKKVLIKDTDGSLFQNTGVAFSRSELYWGGDPRRGLGDYRIPVAAQTRPDGSRIDVEELSPNKGIFRTANCSERADQNMWFCTDEQEYRMMIVESMDFDTGRHFALFSLSFEFTQLAYY